MGTTTRYNNNYSFQSNSCQCKYIGVCCSSATAKGHTHRKRTTDDRCTRSSFTEPREEPRCNLCLTLAITISARKYAIHQLCSCGANATNDEDPQPNSNS